MPKTMYPRSKDTSTRNVLLRMPESLLEACHAAAHEEHRNLQGQLLHVIEAWLQSCGRLPTNERQRREAPSAP